MQNQKNANLKKSNSIRRFLSMLLLAIVAIGAYAQQNKVTGTVVDANGEPIIGASVIVKGTSNGGVTDLDGNFTINNVQPNQSIVVSYIGYTSRTVAVKGKSNFQIVLKSDDKLLDEVVVVGYGVQRKSDVTGALAHLDSKELTKMPVSNALEAMQGKAAGVDITNSQRPGEVGSITIRGSRSIGASNDPLYVVDGMVIQNGGIDNINPQDIESIEVLKDASATAIYGSRGANGVVLVTTKKGKDGRLTLNYSGTVTISNLSEVADYMNAAEWLQYARQAKFNMGSYASTVGSDGYVVPNYEADHTAFGNVAASWANIDQAWSNGNYDPSKVGGYDWISEGKQTGVTHEHTLSASGGTDKFKGYGSVGYLEQKGTQPGQSYNRFTFNTSVEFTPLKYFTMGMTMNASYAHQDYGYNFSKSVTGAGDFYGALRGMLPWTSPYDADGNYIRLPNGDINIINPINELNYNTNQRRTFRINGSAYAQVDFGKIWEPLQGLSYRFQFGPELRYYNLGIANAAEGINGDGNNKAQVGNTNNRSWTLDNLIYYNKTIAEKHHIGLTLMQSASKFHQDGADMTATNVATAKELWYNLGSSSSLSGFGSSLKESQMTSYMGRINYNFNDRYLLTASMRWDGSSVLSPGHKWASFPSVALGWRIDQEKFMEKLSWISNLKLRLGYGITGNAAILPYDTKGAIQGAYYNWGGGDSVIGYVPSDPSAKNPNKMANQDLGWEKTTQYNLGLDFGFLGGRIGGSFDVYKTKTKDLLLPMTIPSLTGYTSTMANVGKTEGWGIDLQLTAIPVKTKDFEWSTTLTWSLDRDEIKELANGITEDVNNRWFVGKSINVEYDYVYDGIWKTSEAEEAAKFGRKPGQIKVKDLTEDGKIDANDRQIVGHKRPDWSGGWNNTFTYKNFELSAFIVARYGFTVRAGAMTLDGRYMARKVDYWVAGSNENAEYYAPGSNGEAADTYSSSMNYQDGSYIKMRNISLGYNFTAQQLKPLGLNSLKVYVQAQNPFSIYKATDWLDTDLVSYANNDRTFASEVTIRSWVIGLNIGF